VEKAKNRNKSRVRAELQHGFGVIKNIFGFRMTRYRGQAKNPNRPEVTAALTNLYMVLAAERKDRLPLETCRSGRYNLPASRRIGYLSDALLPVKNSLLLDCNGIGDPERHRSADTSCRKGFPHSFATPRSRPLPFRAAIAPLRAFVRGLQLAALTSVGGTIVLLRRVGKPQSRLFTDGHLP
jgi:hypothetical protein